VSEVRAGGSAAAADFALRSRAEATTLPPNEERDHQGKTSWPETLGNQARQGTEDTSGDGGGGALDSAE
jgi:hypothetical protein